jgi:hypothetical protein
MTVDLDLGLLLSEPIQPIVVHGSLVVGVSCGWLNCNVGGCVSVVVNPGCYVGTMRKGG